MSCSDDMTVGVVTISNDGSLTLTKLFHGHVSRVRSIDVQGDRILSGSDDRSVKLWTLEPSSPGEITVFHCLLYILTRIWVLHTPSIGLIMPFQCFSHKKDEKSKKARKMRQN